MKSLFICILLAGVIISTAFIHTNTSAMNNDNNYSVEIIRYNIPAAQHTSFESAYRGAGKLLQASSYCLGYQLIHGSEEPDNYILIIRWTSTADHLNGFRKSAEFMSFFNLVKPFYNHIREMKHYDLTDLHYAKG